MPKTKECYSIIRDEGLLNDFVDWLPTPNRDQKFYLSLFGRKKYTSAPLKSDKTQLRRFTANKDNIIQKIRQLEVGLGLYLSGDVAVPEESLALYINPNPRDMLKATREVARKSLDLCLSEHHGYNIHAEALSCIQRAKPQRAQWQDFDIDDSSFDLNILKKILNNDCYRVLKTRGGFHVLVEPRKVSGEYKKTYYKNMLKYTDQVKDNMLPCPGVCQGEFVPHFVK